MLPIIVLDKIDASQKQWMFQKWKETAEAIGIRASQIREFFDLICEQYTQKHRAYHNLSHLYSLFQIAEKYHFHIQDRKLVELSIWFHDIIYSIRRKDNEAKSAELASELLKPYLDAEAIDKVSSMIRATSSHKSQNDFSDSKYLLDFDLAILGTERAVYKKYKKAIRKEFKRYPNFLYKIGRRKVLLHFLAMDRIYQSDQFHEGFEQIARENLQWEIDTI